jgi:hypothetical protein
MPSFVQDPNNTKGHEDWKQFYGDWHELVASNTAEVFYEKLDEFKEQYIPSHTSEVGYITETWLDLYKERFIKPWVNQYTCFNQYVTSRCEGIHQLIKSYLKTSQVDLFETWRTIKLVLTNQLAELERNRAKQQISFPLKLSGVLYGNIRGWILHEALRMVDTHRERLLHKYPECTESFTKTLGLTCAHIIEP